MASTHPCSVKVTRSGGGKTARWDRPHPSPQACDIRPFPGCTGGHGNWGARRIPSSHSGPCRSVPLSCGNAPEWTGSLLWPRMTDRQSLPCRRTASCTVSHLSRTSSGKMDGRVLGLGRTRERVEWSKQDMEVITLEYTAIYYHSKRAVLCIFFLIKMVDFFLVIVLY